MALVGIIGSLYGLAGTLRDLLPLTIVAVCSIVIGAVCIAAAGPLLRVEAKAANRLLRKRIAIGNADVWTFRMVGLAIVVGGIWLAR